MKRFTDTLKWQDPWFRRLSSQSKLLWFYLVDHCDNIGLVDLDLNLVSSDCGTKITDAHISELSDRVQVLDDGKVFITKFIPFQYGTLSEACVPHKKVIQAVKYHSLTQTFNGFLYPTARVGSTLLRRVIDRANNKEENKEENKDKDRTTRARGTFEEVSEFCKEIGLFPRDVEYIWNNWEANGWKRSGKPIKDWKATIRAWKAQKFLPSQRTPSPDDKWPTEAPQPIDWSEDDNLLAKLLAKKPNDEPDEESSIETMGGSDESW
jgi:hypothetical protein